VDEDAIDEGGVSREYFYQIATAIFSPDYAIFEEKNNVYWFSLCKFAEPRRARILGVLVGLALNNGVVLPIRFPLLLYEKLCGVLSLSLKTLAEIEPEIAASLQQLLTSERDSVGDVGLTFSREIDDLGAIDTYELIDNGRNIPVTSENIDKYVEAYIQWTLVSSVQVLYQQFEDGFKSVCYLPIYTKFSPDELDVLVSGVDVVNWDELKMSVTYGGYTATSESIVIFWEVFDGLTVDQKKNLLVFATGTAKVPIGGLSKVKLKIVREPRIKLLPVAHTCNATLELPDYRSLALMKKSVEICLENLSGFGLK
jgi:hypothetical protein